jgi:hypothetical protein
MSYPLLFLSNEQVSFAHAGVFILSRRIRHAAAYALHVAWCPQWLRGTSFPHVLAVPQNDLALKPLQKVGI